MRSFKQIVSALVFTLAFVFFLSKPSQAQDTSAVTKDTTVTPMDTTVTPKDTTAVTPKDTTVAPAAAPAAAATTQTTESAPAEKPKGKSTFIIYAGPNVSTLRVNSEELSKESKTGFHIGLSWRKSRIFLYPVGSEV